MHHHGDGLVGVEICFAIERGEAEEGFLCIFRAAFADEPPGAFWGHEDANEEWNWPHPLQGIGDAVGPLICATQHRFDDADADGLAQTPAEIDVRREVASKSHWAYF